MSEFERRPSELLVPIEQRQETAVPTTLLGFPVVPVERDAAPSCTGMAFGDLKQWCDDRGRKIAANRLAGQLDW